MRLEQLYHVLQVAKYQSISKTSKQIYVAQSTISTSVSSLEEELGVQLFNRSQQGVSLTETGDLILQKIGLVFEQIEDIKELSSAKSGCIKGRIDILTMKGFGDNGLMNMLKQFKDQFPCTSLYVREERIPSIITAVFNGEANLGIIATEIGELQQFKKELHNKNLTYTHLGQDVLQAYCNSQHPFANQKVCFNQLIDYDLVSYSNMNVYPSLGGLNRAYHFESQEMIKRMLADSDHLITFLPASTLSDDIFLKYGMIQPIYITDFEILIDVGYITVKNNVLSTLEKKFINLLNSAYSSCVIDNE